MIMSTTQCTLDDNACPMLVQTVNGGNTNMVQMNLNHTPGFCVQDSVQTQRL